MRNSDEKKNGFKYEMAVWSWGTMFMRGQIFRRLLFEWDDICLI